MPLRENVDLDVERQRTSAGGGGLLGAAISAGVNAIQDNVANKKGKQDPKFWKRAIAVIMVTSQGRVSFASRKAKDMGVLLANARPNLGAIEQYPNVPFQA